jgi:glycosyltransferase involved in cell wall biosynthesis
MSSAKPILSVITVCFNAEKTIAKTILSVSQQSYQYIEHIIVDGASTDGTMNIVNNYKDNIAVIISEKDNGLYDGMNKGLKAATGDYIYFLNADDEFYATSVVEKIFAVANDADVYYGEVMFTNSEEKEMGLRSSVTNQKTPETLNWKSLQKGMVVSHQAFFIKRKLAVEYDLNYKICSDIDWMIKCLKNCNSIINTKLVFAKFAAGGTSKQRQKLAWQERFFILQKHYGVIKNWYNHGLIIIRRIFSRQNY